jgi:hypothetical protein
MVALTVRTTDAWWYYDEGFGTFMYVNVESGKDTPLSQDPWLNPDYIIGDLEINDLRISVSF